MTATFTCERSFVSVRSGTFNVELHQAGAGEPLLVLHDMSARRPWAPYMDDLANRFRVVAPSLPGFRYSTGLEHIDDAVDMAVFLADLLDVLGIEQATVLGHELGAMFAAELAALSPGRVSRLLLVAPVGLRSNDGEMADLAAIDPAAIPGLLWADPESAVAKDWNAMPLEPAAVEEETVLRARALGSASRFVWPFPERGLHKRVHRIQAPTLIVWGAEDGLTPRGLAEAFDAAIPQARLHVMPNVGHFPMLEAPSEFVRLAFELAAEAAR
jgi:pimeloyl-ACP methyl ester carboxylesterase